MCLRDEGELWTFYREAYEVDRRLEPESAMRSIARATQVTARMLDGIAVKYRLAQKPFKWFATFASVFWGVVEAAPNAGGSAAPLHAQPPDHRFEFVDVAFSLT